LFVEYVRHGGTCGGLSGDRANGCSTFAQDGGIGAANAGHRGEIRIPDSVYAQIAPMDFSRHILAPATERLLAFRLNIEWNDLTPIGRSLLCLKRTEIFRSGRGSGQPIHYASGDRRGGIVLGIARDYSSLRDKGMIFEQVWLLVLNSPLVLWMIFASYRSRTAGRFAINIFETLLLFAFGLTGFVLRKSNVAAEALAQALNGLSDTDLKQGKRRIYVIETNNWKAIQVKQDRT
jgi:hypothetical protein